MANPVFRLEAHFSGRVQGVGFRYSTRQIALGFSVTGQVHNLEDGRVHLVAEGQEAEIREFLREIQSQMQQYIKETTVDEKTGPAQFRDFQIA